MSEANKQVVRRWFNEVWNKQRREAIGEMLSPDSILHEGSESMRGPQGFYAFFERMHSAFSDIRITIDDEIAEGEKVTVRWSCTMRHTGSGLGMPPTHKQLQTTGITIVRVENDKILEGWQNWDMLGLFHQIRQEPLGATYLTADAARAADRGI